MGERLSVRDNMEMAPGGGVQEAAEAADEQESLDGKQIAQRAMDNINAIAERVAEQSLDLDSGEIDIDRQQELVKESLSSMAQDVVTEADEDGVRTPEEQDSVSEVFQTALVFGVEENASGASPKENLVVRLHENPLTASDLERAIDAAAEANVTLDNSGLLAESIAGIIYAAQEGEASASSGVEVVDEQELKEKQAIEDGMSISVGMSFAAILYDYQERMGNKKKGEPDLATDEIVQALLDASKSIDSDKAKEWIAQLRDSKMKTRAAVGELQYTIEKELLELDLDRILDAKADSADKAVIIGGKVDNDECREEIISSIPKIVDVIGADNLSGPLFNGNVFSIEECSQILKGVENANDAERFREDMVESIKTGCRRMPLDEILDDAPKIKRMLGDERAGRAVVGALGTRSEKWNNGFWQQLARIDSEYGADVAGAVKEAAIKEVEAVANSDKEGVDWLLELSAQNNGLTIQHLLLLGESDDENMQALSSEMRMKIVERLKEINPDSIMDYCADSKTSVGAVAGISEVIDEAHSSLTRPLSFFVRAYKSSSPELSSYSKNLLTQHYRCMRSLEGASEEERQSAEQKYENLLTLFESNVPTYQKLAKAERLYYEVNLDGLIQGRSVLNIQEFEMTFPEMQGYDATRDEKVERIEGLVRQDLLRSAVRSNNLQLRDYLADASDLISFMSRHEDDPKKIAEEIESLGEGTEERAKAEARLRQALETRELQKAKIGEISSVLRDFRDAFGLEETPSPDGEKRPMDSVLDELGLEWMPSPEEALQLMESIRLERDKKKRESVIEDPANPGRYILKEPIKAQDPKKGFKPDFLDFQFQDGFNCPESLGYGGYSDATSGDADFSASNPDIIEKEKAGKRIDLSTQLINSVTAGDGYGRVKLVFRSDERFTTIAADGTEGAGSEQAPYHLITNAGHSQYAGRESNFIGVRTGLGSLDVDAFIVHDGETIWDNDGKKHEGFQIASDRQYLKRLKFEIIKSGCYTPIVGQETGEVLFTPQEYDEMRKKVLGGVHGYENKASGERLAFDFSDSLEIDDSVLKKLGLDASFDEIVEDYDENERETTRINNAIAMRMLGIIENSDLDESTKEVFRSASSSLSDINPFGGVMTANIFGTGSTARGVNEPGDGDYDYLICLDNRILSRDGGKIARLLNDGLRPESNRRTQGDSASSNLNIRGLKTNTDFLGVMHKTGEGSSEIEIDISIEAKNDRVRYSTNTILGQFYEDLSQQEASDDDRYKQVVANVRIAKKLLKKYGCYKKQKSAGAKEGYGGIGGIGVENLILQNNGSLHDAAQSFVEATRDAVRKRAEDDTVMSDEQIDEQIKVYAKQVQDALKTTNGEIPEDVVYTFDFFRDNFFLFDRGQNFPTVDKRVSAREQREGYRDDGYAFDDLVSGGRFEPGGWLRMYEAFKDLLDAWPEEAQAAAEMASEASVA